MIPLTTDLAMRVRKGTYPGSMQVGSWPARHGVGGWGTAVAEDRLLHAQKLYEQAVFGGDEGVLDNADAELDGVEADLALAEVASEAGDVEQARTLIAEAADTGAACGAYGILRWIEAFRDELG